MVTSIEFLRRHSYMKKRAKFLLQRRLKNVEVVNG